MQTYSTETRLEVSVPDTVKEALDAFVPPAGTERGGSHEQGYIYSWGAYCVPRLGVTNVEPRFFCLASGACRNNNQVIPCKNGDRSNVNKHLKSVHKLVSKTSMVWAEKKSDTDDGVLKVQQGTRTLGVGKIRTLELLYVRLLVKKLLPTNFAEDPEWRALMQAHGNTKFPNLCKERVRHLLMEMYEATKENIVDGLQAEIEAAHLPILHFTMDLWTCKTSGEKFIGIRLFWVDREFVLHNALLSVKPYCPQPGGVESEGAAAVLWRFFMATISDFGLRLENFASCTTSGVSDVKSMCLEHAIPAGIPWDWCLLHMVDEVCECALGTFAHPAQSRNPEARNLNLLVIKVVEKLSKFPTWKEKLGGIQVEDLWLCLMVKRAPWWWVSLVQALERVIRLWHPLRKLYALRGEGFPLDEGNNRAGILQLYSLMEPLARITRDARSRSLPMNGEMHMALSKLKATTLAEGKPLKVFLLPDPAFSGSKAKVDLYAPLKFSMVPAEDLTDVALITRRELSTALISRYIGQVWDDDRPGPSFFKDAAVMLTPPYHSGKHLDLLKLVPGDNLTLPFDSALRLPTPESDVDQRRRATWDEIRARAILAVQAEITPREDGLGLEPREAKRPRSSPSQLTAVDSGGGEDAWAMFGSASDVDTKEEKLSPEEEVARLVDEEIKRFQNLKVKPQDLPPRGALSYWTCTGKLRFRMLRSVAQQTYGSQASSAQIEHDFGGADQLLRSRKTRMDVLFLETMLFLHLNFEQIPAGVPSLLTASQSSFIPKRFRARGEDCVLQGAEECLDPRSIVNGIGVADLPTSLSADDIVEIVE